MEPENICPSAKGINHGVLATGYTIDYKTGNAWITFKNSWGSYWGEKGFFSFYVGNKKVGERYDGPCNMFLYGSFLKRPTL